ncbi:MAG: hypothetical protein N4A57_05260 [Anaeromicrobium sp.]|jgi:hypothetical protein|uniref:hypothetical protein n=1 Tax=Anaeromicrobium sp. TaxID=1929132 RepID=UPI0025DC66B1|nr:hypothetical protein [Anaeromicrobium sp.]MCT4593662.1 hypothetical protein [Anaeromicrobium sp.]
MILKIILTIMLCIPMACLQIYLIRDAIEEMGKKPSPKKESIKKDYGHMRIAK